LTIPPSVDIAPFGSTAPHNLYTLKIELWSR